MDGVDYRFVSPETFSSMIRDGLLLEWAEFAGYRYGTLREEILQNLEKGRDVIMDIELNGALRVMDMFPEAVSIYVMPPSINVLEGRLRTRLDMSEDQIATRLALGAEQMKVGPEHFRHVVVNEDLDVTVAEIMDIIVRTVREASPEGHQSTRRPVLLAEETT